MQCAAATFQDLYCGSGAQPIGAEVRYWENLKQGRPIFDLAAQFPGCR
jgi:hypothetical protein